MRSSDVRTYCILSMQAANQNDYFVTWKLPHIYFFINKDWIFLYSFLYKIHFTRILQVFGELLDSRLFLAQILISSHSQMMQLFENHNYASCSVSVFLSLIYDSYLEIKISFLITVLIMDLKKCRLFVHLYRMITLYNLQKFFL